MKRLMIIISCLGLLTTSAQAGIADEVGGVREAYNQFLVSVEKDEEAVFGEMLVKKVLVQAIEAIKDVNAATGVDTLEGAPLYVNIPVGIIALGTAGSGGMVANGVVNRLTPSISSKEFAERLVKLQRDQLKAAAALKNAKAGIFPTPLATAAKAQYITSLQTMSTTKSTQLATMLKRTPGPLHGIGRTARFLSKGSLLIGGVAAAAMVIADGVILELPGATNELLDSLYADIATAESLLVDIEANRE